MKLPVAIPVLLFAIGAALPAVAATHPSVPVELVQYRPTDRPHADRPQTTQHRDGYNAHASAPAAPDSNRATPARDSMPPGWHCLQHGGGDPSANPSWQFCD